MNTKTTGTAYRFKVGANIRKWRNLKDIKQKDLATAMRLSDAAVSNIENDVTNITISQLEDIAQVLNVPIEQLLSDPQEKFRSPLVHYTAARDEQPDKELVAALISSLEKKDQQMQLIIQHFIHVVSTLVQQEKIIFDPLKRAASRA